MTRHGSLLIVLLATVTGVVLLNEGKTQTTSYRDLNTHHCLVPPASREAWEARATALRRQILVSAGLWPVPAKTPLRPIVTGRTVHRDFIVENVSIETLPGFRLCGNLYRPAGRRGPFPAIANPHGHWAAGRLEMQPDVERAAPPPAPPAEGRANLPAIGVNLARQGFIVFAYDMVGYNDTSQVNHQFAGSLMHWYRGVSLMGLQLWNSIRAVDFLCSLKDVDPKRIGATGASGGGTQTFLLTAVDDRVRSAVPVNMISASMQGGCLCENGPALRLDTDNVEIAALAAPRPLLLIAATGDWTRNNPAEEWPAIRAVYRLLGAEDRTVCVQFNYGHNYNVESREAMYAWFRKTLGDRKTDNVREDPFELRTDQLRVWNTEHPAPRGLHAADALTEALCQRSGEALRRIWPRRPSEASRFRRLMVPAITTVLGIPEADATPVRQPAAGTSIAILVRSLADPPQATETLASALRTQYHAIQTVEVADTTIDPAEWWKDFRSCYNLTPFAQACGQVVTVLREQGSKYGRVDVVGLGQAGPIVLFARALVPCRGAVVVDPQWLLRDREARIKVMYAPCLEGLGGRGTALALISPSPVLLPGGPTDLRPLLPDATFATGALTVRICGDSPADVARMLRQVMR